MKYLKYILFPFAVLYGLVVRLRHWCYAVGIFKEHTFAVPTICVGNVAVGGTGKSPMVEYLIRQLSPNYYVGVLSRGYKRKTKGFVLANENSTVLDLGDEPFQFWRKFGVPSSGNKQLTLAVCGSRVEGIRKMLALPIPPEVIILDDAFQHRAVKAQTNVVLTAYGQLFTNDWLLPVGRLRDVVSRVQKADVVVVTKCPSDLPQEEREEITQQLRKYCACPIVFASIAYDKEVFSARGNVSLSAFIQEAFTLVTGIANPLPLMNYLKEQGARFEHLAFADHHHFSTNEIQQLQRKRILTTEKDYVRLQPHLEGLYYLLIGVDFLTPTDANIFGTVFGKYITITNNKK